MGLQGEFSKSLDTMSNVQHYWQRSQTLSQWDITIIPG
jgi:hypothetical protein